MNTSKKKFTRILAVVGAALIACCVKLWWDMKSTPPVVYSNIAASSKDLSDTASGASDNTSKTGKDTGADSGADSGADTGAGTGAGTGGSSGSTPETSHKLPVASPVPEVIPVYICGCVANPGIYQTVKGTYLYEVIYVAGGLLPEAADEYMNLVFQFTGAVSVYIPSNEEMKAFLDGTVNSSSEYLRSGLIQGIWGKSPSSGALPDSTNTTVAPALININTADQKQLETLPGVGETTAKAIISYRQKSGGFAKIEDIMNVAGIKEGRFEAIREYITV